MTENRRIILNVIATYGRSLYGMALGLFTCRWLLEALGEIDYGLIGLVGGLTGFVTFLNGLMAESVSRFYAFSVGKSKASSDKVGSLEDCRAWFSIAVVIHSILPVVLLAIGYPIGEWLVRHWLVIPADRIVACVWVWRISCFSCFLGMINVPFQAMYNAKQEIAELTIYSFATTTMTFIFIWFMVCHPADWMVQYVLWSTVMAAVPTLIICVRAVIKYPECRMRFGLLNEWHRYRELAVYAGSRFLGAISQMCTSQGMSIVVNKLLGPARNAAMAIGWTVTSKTMTLKSSFCAALEPAIVNAAGAGDYEKVRRLSFRADIACTLSIAVFAIPLILEIDKIMVLWLKNPPPLSGRLCQLWLLAFLIDQMTMGNVFALFGKGRIAMFQIGESIIWISALFIAWMLIALGMDIPGVGLGWMIMYAMDNVLKIYCSRREIGMSVRYWFYHVVTPIVLVCAVTILAGLIPRLLLSESFVRICITTIVCEAVFMPLVWFCVLEENERNKIKVKLFRKHQ